ncbi:hypothetical protein [Streptomyces mirabilis]|uniref:hypothetical protein n=1 Tax=Streptomyces mirabilis TaxID=68239 RepID=UPI0036AACBA8
MTGQACIAADRARAARRLRAVADQFFAAADSRQGLGDSDWYAVYTELRLTAEGLEQLPGVKRRQRRAVRRACAIAKGEVDGHASGIAAVAAMCAIESVADELDPVDAPSTFDREGHR